MLERTDDDLNGRPEVLRTEFFEFDCATLASPPCGIDTVAPLLIMAVLEPVETFSVGQNEQSCYPYGQKSRALEKIRDSDRMISSHRIL